MRGVLETGRIIDSAHEDPEERRKRIEAEENASKFGTALGLAIGVIAAAVEDTEDVATEENDEPTMKM